MLHEKWRQFSWSKLGGSRELARCLGSGGGDSSRGTCALVLERAESVAFEAIFLVYGATAGGASCYMRSGATSHGANLGGRGSLPIAWVLGVAIPHEARVFRFLSEPKVWHLRRFS